MHYNLFAPANLPFIIYIVLGLILFIQLYYIVFVYSKLAFHKVKSNLTERDLPPVSVIICAYNEQHNLTEFLPTVLEQNYPDFEVIVVNDCSTDDTHWILRNFGTQYKHLKIVEIQEFVKLKHNKKFAMTLGIKAAKNELLVMTDADCQPHNANWLTELVGAYDEQTDIVLGYSPYSKTKGFLNKLIRFETTHTAMSYLSYALKKETYMGVGRNLSYKKSLFFKGKGFNTHMHLKSGDDDLFVNANATATNVRIAIHPDAFVYSKPKTSVTNYYRQKARHSSASVMYKARHKRMLATQLISSLLFYLLLLTTLILYPQYWFVPTIAYVLRLTCQVAVFFPIFKKLAVKDLLIWLPILDLFYYFYICFNGLFNRHKKPIWK